MSDGGQALAGAAHAEARQAIAEISTLRVRIDAIESRLRDHLPDGEPVRAVVALPTVQIFSGTYVGGRAAYVRIVDLGDQIPGVDAKGNMFEAFTTLFQIDGERWEEIVTDRGMVEAGVTTRELKLSDRLARFGVDVSSLRDRYGRGL